MVVKAPPETEHFGATTSLPSVTIVLPFLKRHVNVVFQCVAFSMPDSFHSA